MRIRVADEALLSEIADQDGITASDVIRLFIRREHAARFGTKPPKAKKRAK